jgi:hypothetical protein
VRQCYLVICSPSAIQHCCAFVLDLGWDHRDEGVLPCETQHHCFRLHYLSLKTEGVVPKAVALLRAMEMCSQNSLLRCRSSPSGSSLGALVCSSCRLRLIDSLAVTCANPPASDPTLTSVGHRAISQMRGSRRLIVPSAALVSMNGSVRNWILIWRR